MEFNELVILALTFDSELRIDVTDVLLAVIASILGLLLVKKTHEERETISSQASRQGPRPATSEVGAATMAPLPPAAAASQADPRLLAVLTAAAAMVVGRPVALHRITFINRDTVSGWAEAGRTSIHLSHNPRRN